MVEIVRPYLTIGQDRLWQIFTFQSEPIFRFFRLLAFQFIQSLLHLP